ncbi:hypothetical protein CY34DRAFT_809720 [Suillus luteus UH-Slu-Lm8-n1]|uniref:Uncharacterized protein n=1 Tax=Suillus luteus UH-Slu-Lm8-n1 TaxID=930992 RepID=A0A0C9ZKV1_9AGAM|nr:hypothetical protein CY34DRAFT_809720 [Suillus luteus UH-Slu-Lm8-n1]
MDTRGLALRASTDPTDCIDALTFSAIFLPIDHLDEHCMCNTASISCLLVIDLGTHSIVVVR